MEQYIALFASARKVVQADDICREANISIEVIHTPKKYSNECGMCLRIPQHSIAPFERLMQQHLIKYQLYNYE